MKLLFDERYHKAAAALMFRAKKEIFLISFVFGYPIRKKDELIIPLFEQLLAAKKRAVDCRIIMNYTLPENVISRDNKAVSTWLRDNGIPCRYLPRNRVVHAKMLIIDGATAVLGSHNWTQRAGTRNLEASVAIDDLPVVFQARQRFLKLWAQAVRMP